MNLHLKYDKHDTDLQTSQKKVNARKKYRLTALPPLISKETEARGRTVRSVPEGNSINLVLGFYLAWHIEIGNEVDGWSVSQPVSRLSSETILHSLT